MTEAVLQSELLHYLKEYKPIGNFVCELKLVKQPKQKNFRACQLQEHQWQTLLQLGDDPFAYKISDSLGFGGMGRFTALKPLDFVYMQHPDVYIGIAFWQARIKKIVYFIKPEDLQWLRVNMHHLSEAIIEINSVFSIDLKTKKLIKYKVNEE